MHDSTLKLTLRYLVSILIVGIFVFPIAWWGLTSVKPISAVFDKDRIVVFDFEPTLENYRVTVLGYSKRGSKEDGKTLMGSSGNN